MACATTCIAPGGICAVTRRCFPFVHHHNGVTQSRTRYLNRCTTSDAATRSQSVFKQGLNLDGHTRTNVKYVSRTMQPQMRHQLSCIWQRMMYSRLGFF